MRIDFCFYGYQIFNGPGHEPGPDKRTLELGFRGREFSRYDFVLESGFGVGAIAEWFVLRLAAAAEANRGAARQPERGALLVYYFKIAFKADKSVIENRYFCRCHM